MSSTHQLDIGPWELRIAMYAHLGPDAIDALHEEHRFRLLHRRPRRHSDHDRADRFDHDRVL